MSPTSIVAAAGDRPGDRAGRCRRSDSAQRHCGVAAGWPLTHCAAGAPRLSTTPAYGLPLPAHQVVAAARPAVQHCLPTRLFRELNLMHDKGHSLNQPPTRPRLLQAAQHDDGAVASTEGLPALGFAAMLETFGRRFRRGRETRAERLATGTTRPPPSAKRGTTSLASRPAPPRCPDGS